MTLLRRYEPATRCTGGPTPGAKALMAWGLGRYGERGLTNLGIYNCRPVRGSNATTSLHGEGRAVDFGINPHGAAYGNEIAELLRAKSGELGVQCVIWKRAIWSSAYPDSGWRRYSGTNPHMDHIHVELNKAAAADLTPQMIQAVLAPRSPDPDPAPAPPIIRSREDDCMLIKTQPDKSKPGTLAALLSGPMFVGLGPTETPSDEQAARMGLTVLWVEYATWQELDKRSHALCDRPMRVITQSPVVTRALAPQQNGPASQPEEQVPPSTSTP